MEIKDYCDFDTCLDLKALGYDKGCEYTYCNHCRVSDEILEKHPGLSDSGYQDLIDKYGGPYKIDEVYKHYIEPLKRFSRNSMIDDEMGELCSCVHLYDAQDFLLTIMKLHITVFSSSQESWMYRITKPHQALEDGAYGEDFPSFKDALHNAIIECINIIQNKNYENA